MPPLETDGGLHETVKIAPGTERTKMAAMNAVLDLTKTPGQRGTAGHQGLKVPRVVAGGGRSC
jgi:hypothetical protein